jgi:hypothetical protein
MNKYSNQYLCMKTTIDLPDELAIQAKKAAVERRTTLRDLVVRGLRHVLSESEELGGEEPIDQLRKLDNDVWHEIDPDRYVRDQRSGWQ